MSAPASLPDHRLFEAVQAGLIHVSLSGHILAANSAFAHLCGRHPDQLVGLHIFDLTHPDDVHASRVQLDALQAGYHTQYRLQKRYVHAEGHPIWVNASVSLLRNAQGEAESFVATIEDLGERRIAADDARINDATERANQAKFEFLARMSHALRTPLNAMLGFTQLLRVAPHHALPSEQQDHIHHIEGSGQQLLSMLNDVLTLAQIESGQWPMALQPCSVRLMMEEVLSLVSNQTQPHPISLSHTPMVNDLSVWADPARLRHILQALLRNAIQYNRPHGQVMLDARPFDQHVVITISDSGWGLSPEHLRHLFEPFNRLGTETHSRAGTGMGLLIVKRLLEQMQGRIEVSSTLNRGSSFRVWLPQLPHAHTEATAPESAATTETRVTTPPQPEPRRATRRILYAEDNVTNIELVRQIVRMRPEWQLSVAHSGQDAISLALSQPPDLLLLDMHLGDMSCLEVSDALTGQNLTAHIPRVALSADVMPEQIREARQRGFLDYLTKPLDVSRLLKLLDTLGTD